MHLLWLVMMLVILAVVIVPVVVLVAVLSRNANGSGRQALSQAQLSADGKWWWDGRQWRPMPPPPAAGPVSGTPPQ